MRTLSKPFASLTAGDLMNRDVVLLPEDMPLREAACLLLQNQIGGAPVGDARGRCVGVLTAIDFLRLVAKSPNATRPTAPARPVTCSFQTRVRLPGGREMTLCLLPPGVCPIQVHEKGPAGENLIRCSQPNCVLYDWQIVNVEELPTDSVKEFMTPDPVTTGPGTPVHTLARMFIDAHIHRVIVVDEGRRPLGVVSSTDILAAVANSVGKPCPDGNGAPARANPVCP